MSARPNVFRPDGLEGVETQQRTHPGFEALRFRLGWALGTERLGASMFEVAAGQTAYPYHYHLAEEELVVVIAGEPSLRGPDGVWEQLAPGDVVSFPRGEGGVHQLANFTTATVRFLALSTSGDPDIVLYPESGKLAAAERHPTRAGLLSVHRLADAVDYHDGERPPTPPAV